MQPANNWTSTVSLSTPPTLNPTSYAMQLRKSARKIPGLTADDVASYSPVNPNKRGVTSPFKSILNLFTTTSPPTKSPLGRVVQPINVSVTKLSLSAPPLPPSPLTIQPDPALQSVIINQPQSAPTSTPPSPALAPAASNKTCPWKNWSTTHNDVFNENFNDSSSVTSSNSSLDREMANSLIPNAFSGLSTEDAAEFISVVEN